MTEDRSKLPLPSVTQIINAACANWIPTEYFTEKSRDRGSAVHEWCAAYAQKTYAIPVRQEWRGYCQSFKLWADQYLVNVMMCEQRLINDKYGYCGKPDIICEMKGRTGYGLIDIKTGGRSITHRMQVAAYRVLAAYSGVLTAWGSVLRLKEDGSMPLMDVMPNDYSSDYNIFLSALNLFNFFK